MFKRIIKKISKYSENSKYNFVMAVIAIAFFVFFSKPVFASEISSNNLMDYINFERIARGIEPLVYNQGLYSAAFNKAQDMLTKEYFDHDTPYGKPWYNFINENGYDYVFAGENLAMDFKTSEGAHYALMQSPLHRNNIINPNFKEVGIGVVKGKFAGRETTIAVEIFGSKRISGLEPIIQKITSSLQYWLSF